MSKPKYPFEVKMQIVATHQAGEASCIELAREYGIGITTVKYWVQKYQEQGEAGLRTHRRNATYSSEFKTKCVKAVLDGEGSIDYIVAKYNISDRRVLRNWIVRYNTCKELKSYNSNRNAHVGVSRKVTQEERQEIVEYCIEHKRAYKETAARYGVSYVQVYYWVKIYDENKKNIHP